MSRIGKRTLKLPDQVKLTFDRDFVNVTVAGPLGTLQKKLSGLIKIVIKDGIVETSCLNRSNQKSLAMWGTTNSLLANWINGVVKGYQKELLIKGLGFKAQLSDRILQLNLGFSHPIDYHLPPGIEVEVIKNIDLKIKGIDKELVGLVASQICKQKKPDVYKGKGVFYKGTSLTLKVGKTATKK